VNSGAGLGREACSAPDRRLTNRVPRGLDGVDTGRMRQAFAHEALLCLEPGGDPHAPGAAITAGLCGHWEHEPPCPLAPHHTAAQRLGGGGVRLRVVFAAEPALESTVRERIEAALARGHLTGPDGVETRWRRRESAAGDVGPDELALAERLREG
jgi:hypothetical protein